MSAKVSEIFYSVQGEGLRTGVLTLFVRFFGCNLRCPGFSRLNPTSALSTPYPINFDPKSITTLKDVPVLEFGCDTYYAIDPKFKHLRTDYESAERFAEEIRKYLPSNEWIHPNTGNDIDICFSGGEPMMQQEALADVCKVIAPKNIQIETNGTKLPGNHFLEWFKHGNFNLYWNISPKLYNVSGENDERAWYPNVIEKLWSLSPYGCLKFVVNESELSWIELNNKVKQLRNLGVDFPIYVMPAGATYEQQTDYEYLGKIATRAVNEGYHVSSRLQNLFWKNVTGV